MWLSYVSSSLNNIGQYFIIYDLFLYQFVTHKLTGTVVYGPEVHILFRIQTLEYKEMLSPCGCPRTKILGTIPPIP